MTGSSDKENVFSRQKTTILGLMSGSSLDGIDMALCEFTGMNSDIEWQILKTTFVPMPAQWKQRLDHLPRDTANSLALADYEFGYFLGELCREKFGAYSIDYIASHGHTIFHAPETGMTCQIGNGAAIAGASGVSVICDFRSMDVALGGQGAPIVAYLDRYGFGTYDVLVNLGGILNLSFNLPDKTLAWDVCPCNQLLNFLSAKAGLVYDKDGEMASKGQVRQDLLAQLLSDPYFGIKPPKTLDNQYISTHFVPVLEQYCVGSNEDKLRTVVEMIVHSVQNAVRPLLQKKSDQSDLPKILLAGGGTHNTFLVEQLQQNIKEAHIIVPDDTLVDFKEALLMAFLGYLRVMQQENVLASATGAKSNSISGCIYKVIKSN